MAERSKRTSAVAAVVIAALAAAGPAYRGWRGYQKLRVEQAAEQARAAAELAAADRARADQIRFESQAERLRADQERKGRVGANVDAALRQLASEQPMTQCDGALALGRTGSKEHIATLQNVLATATYGSVRNCAASGLVQLGDKQTPLAAYREWAAGRDSDLQRAAIMGFGEVGPEAAEDALPYLHAWANSPHMDERYLAVESLSKLGPAGMPLLEQLASDTDKNVRERALSIVRGTTARE